MAPATSESKSNPASRLCFLFDSALNEGRAFVTLMAKISHMNLHLFWPRRNFLPDSILDTCTDALIDSRTNLIIGGDFLIYLFFCASTEPQVTQAYEMLQQYQESLQRMASLSDWSTIGLIRPTLLRTESFFHGAAEGIKLAGLEQNLNGA